MSKTHRISIEVSPRTLRWLRALAKSQDPKQHGGPVRVRHLLEQAAECMADCAGRRTGSWEADVARTMLVASGYESEAQGDPRYECYRIDKAEEAAWRATRDAFKSASAS